MGELGEMEEDESPIASKTDEISRRVREMYERGVKVSEIARILGLSMSTIYRILHSEKVKLRRRAYRTRGRVSEEERDLILKLYREGKTIYEIAKIVKRPVSTVHYVVKRAIRGEQA